MKSRKGAASCCVAAALFFSAPLLAPSPAEERTGQATEGQLKELLGRIETLEARVAELEKMHALVVLQAQQAPNLLPKGAVPKQFNGSEFYIIPLETTTAPAMKPE